MAKDGFGRPTVITKPTLLKLDEAFAMGCTDTEACFYANISTTTFYEYQKKTPDFKERKEQLKENPVMLARKSVIDGMVNDPKLAFDYLKNKKSDEFSTKHKAEVSVSPLSALMEEIDGRTADLPRDEEKPQ